MFQSEEYTQAEKSRGGRAWLPWTLLVGVVALAAGLGYLGFEAYGAQRAARLAAEKLNDELQVKFADLDATRSAQQARLASLEAQGATLAQQVQEKDAQIAQLQETYTKLEEQMKAELAAGEIRLSQAGGRLQVDLVDKVLFASGDASLSPRGESVLARLGTVLAGVEGKRIQVSGHTDNAPPSDRLKLVYPTNWELSVARAVTVVRFLSDKTGVPQERLVATGHGEFEPIASNHTAVGRARNRRIEILLVPEVKATPNAEVAKAAPAATPAQVKPASGTTARPAVKSASHRAPRRGTF